LPPRKKRGILDAAFPIPKEEGCARGRNEMICDVGRGRQPTVRLQKIVGKEREGDADREKTEKKKGLVTTGSGPMNSNQSTRKKKRRTGSEHDLGGRLWNP